MQKINLRGFTLVELIVVITILAILGTIGFISLQGYAVNARDSARVSDLNTISRALEYYHLQENHYPNPTDFYSVSYSGSLAWRQGTFGDETRNLTQRISQTPLDPLTKNEYAYSTTNTRQEFELGSITENLVVFNNEATPNSSNLIPSNKAHAVNSYFSYVVGNYNKQIVTAKDTVNINRLYILGVPTIITTEITDVTVQEILANQSFAVDKSQNLPGSYATSLPNDQTIDGNTSFTPGTVTLSAPLIYEGTADNLSDDDDKRQFGEDLKSYYANSDISGKNSYQQLVNTPSGEEIAYINTLVQADTGGIPGDSITVNVLSSNSLNSGASGGLTSVIPPDSCLDMTDTHLANLNNWMSISLSDDFSGRIDAVAEGTSGTSNLTLSQWCNLTFLEAIPGAILSPIPQEVGYLYGLEFLTYSDQGISTIPETLVLLENLKDAYLAGNQLGNLELGRFDWTNGYTCENGVGDQGNDMCLEFANSGVGDDGFSDDGVPDGGLFGDGFPDDGGLGGSDNVRFVFKGDEHVSCEDQISDAQLTALNNWGTVTFADSGPQITIAPGGTSSLTKREWCSVNEISNEVRDAPTYLTYIPEGLSLLPNLRFLSLENEDISVLPDDFQLVSRLEYLNLSGNDQLGNLAFEFNFDFAELCDNVSNGTQVRNICIGPFLNLIEIREGDEI